LLAGLFLYFLGSVFCLLSASLEWLIFGRIVLGFGSGAGTVLMRAMVLDIFPEAKVAGTLAHVTMFMMLVPAVTPAIGGFLADGFGWRSVFWVLSTISGSVMLLVAFYLPESLKAVTVRHDLRKSKWTSFASVFGNRRFLFLAFQSAFTFAVFYYFSTAMPYIMVDLWGFPASEYGLWSILSAGAYLLGNYTTTRYASRWNAELALKISVATVALTPISMASLYSLGFSSPAIFFIPMALHTFACGIINPTSQALAISNISSARGMASSLFAFIQLFVAAIFVQVIGVITPATEWALTLATAFASALAISFTFFGLSTKSAVHFQISR